MIGTLWGGGRKWLVNLGLGFSLISELDWTSSLCVLLIICIMCIAKKIKASLCFT